MPGEWFTRGARGATDAGRWDLCLLKSPAFHSHRDESKMKHVGPQLVYCFFLIPPSYSKDMPVDVQWPRNAKGLVVALAVLAQSYCLAFWGWQGQGAERNPGAVVSFAQASLEVWQLKKPIDICFFSVNIYQLPQLPASEVKSCHTMSDSRLIAQDFMLKRTCKIRQGYLGGANIPLAQSFLKTISKKTLEFREFV